MTDANELREEAQAVSFWLDEKNSQARKELSKRRPELGEWLQMIEARVNAELKKREAQEEVRAKV